MHWIVISQSRHKHKSRGGQDLRMSGKLHCGPPKLVCSSDYFPGMTNKLKSHRDHTCGVLEETSCAHCSPTPPLPSSSTPHLQVFLTHSLNHRGGLLNNISFLIQVIQQGRANELKCSFRTFHAFNPHSCQNRNSLMSQQQQLCNRREKWKI